MANLLQRRDRQLSCRTIVLVLLGAWYFQGALGAHLISNDYDWARLNSSRKLEYSDCYGTLKCARLELPIDRSDPEPGRSHVILAIVRRPAKVPVTHPSYGGALIINPGGPGGSGVDMMLKSGERIQSIVDADAAPCRNSTECSMVMPQNFYDIISFDPRASGYSEPRLTCFPDSNSRVVWNAEAEAEGLIGSSPSALDNKWARYHSRSETCTKSKNGSHNIAFHMGTRSTVDDIIAIAERHGEWREKEAHDILLGHRPALKYDAQQALERVRWRQGEEEVLFWGVSAGTILGSMLAALYPTRVHRMILDSVQTPRDFRNGSKHDSLQDTDKVFTTFAYFCHKHGPERCSFYRDSEQTILQDIENITSSLFESPWPVTGTMTRGPEIVTWSDLKRLIGRSLYDPLNEFPVVAQILEDLFHRNGSSLADHKAKLRASTIPDPDRCKVDAHGQRDETLLGVACGDNPMFRDMSKDDFIDYWDIVREQSQALGDIWAEWDLMCVGWNAESKWKFDGPFAGRPAHPILFVGNKLDPVCPMRNAHTVAKSYDGSVVLTQNTTGHGILSSESTCMETHIKVYFQVGELPPLNSSCEVEREPFQDPVDLRIENSWSSQVDLTSQRPGAWLDGIGAISYRR